MKISAVLFVVAAAMAAAADAHHSIAGAYDSTRSVTIDGAVTQFRFVNPHPYLDVEITDNGMVQRWRLELDNRGELAAIGVDETTLRPRDRIIVTGSPSRTQPNALYVRKLRRPADGFEYEQVGASPRINRR